MDPAKVSATLTIFPTQGKLSKEDIKQTQQSYGKSPCKIHEKKSFFLFSNNELCSALCIALCSAPYRAPCSALCSALCVSHVVHPLVHYVVNYVVNCVVHFVVHSEVHSILQL